MAFTSDGCPSNAGETSADRPDPNHFAVVVWVERTSAICNPSAVSARRLDSGTNISRGRTSRKKLGPLRVWSDGSVNADAVEDRQGCVGVSVVF